MANASVAQSISRVTVAAALQAARTEAAEHQAWITAINKAALNLEACPWQFDGDMLMIASATARGVSYAVDHASCECKAGQAGKPCWHRAAWRLLRKAAEMAALAEELRVTEALSLDDAMQIAAVEVGALHSYAQRWNATVLAYSSRRDALAHLPECLTQERGLGVPGLQPASISTLFSEVDASRVYARSTDHGHTNRNPLACQHLINMRALHACRGWQGHLVQPCRAVRAWACWRTGTYGSMGTAQPCHRCPACRGACSRWTALSTHVAPVDVDQGPATA